ncbi:uncharacterized protein LTR77_000182 [Saxophila tyrrhenica]|uniref:Uncharacterized protein n=1 Tax=Saxophila tyrrhenica TaxID=1690608 RepID=A0AAV9PM23_9PEZI|nr:hypothetical protein LTR77_000182 [Saxophila tyrrhenica]
MHRTLFPGTDPEAPTGPCPDEECELVLSRSDWKCFTCLVTDELAKMQEALLPFPPLQRRKSPTAEHMETRGELRMPDVPFETVGDYVRYCIGERQEERFARELYSFAWRDLCPELTHPPMDEWDLPSRTHQPPVWKQE